MAMAGSDRVTMAGLAVDLAAGVAVDRVVADQDDRLIGGDQGHHEPRELASQPECGPSGTGEDPLVGGAMPPADRRGGAKDVGDGTPAGGEDGRAEQGDEPMGRRLGEDRREGIEHRLGLGG